MKNIRFLIFVLTVGSLVLSACGTAIATPTVASDIATGTKVDAMPVSFIGIVDSIDGDQWVISGTTVTVDESVVHDGPFNAGDQIKVEGLVNPDGSFTVSRVESRTPQQETATPQVGVDNSNEAIDNANDANVNDSNTNDDNDNASNSNDGNVNDDNNGGNTNDDNSNDSNTNDDDGGNSNDDNSNDDHGGNSNDDSGDDDNGNGGHGSDD